MLDLKALAYKFMERGQAMLRKDGELVPVAIVCAPGREYVVGLIFDSANAKYFAYKKVLKLARKTKALAIVAIHDCRFQKYKAASAEEVESLKANYRQGQMNETNSQEALVVMVKTPGEKVWGLMSEYTRNGGGFHFETPKECPGTESALLKDW